MSSLRETLQANLQAVNTRITKAARRAGRDPDAIQLVAVSKTFPAEAVLAAAESGQAAFGENYVQEAVAKIQEIERRKPARPLQWHFIGPIQSNKTRAIAESFDWVQSVDRVRIAERLSQQRPPGRGPLDILLQVNVSGEATKGGVRPEELPAMARAVARLPGLRLRGLMAIPEPQFDPVLQRGPFLRMRQLFDAVRADGLAMDTLSMGMTGDLEAAIEAGATMVRVGTAIFGMRQPALA
jgi:pyridoxal phosphate enzyme (YggS family)